MRSPFIRLMTALAVFLPTITTAAQAQYYTRGHLVQDLRLGVEWMRCTVGQRWNEAENTCQGEGIRLNHDEIASAITQAEEQLGAGWRLPSRDELEALVCATCEPPKIDIEAFPNTMSEPYWTGDRNFWSMKNYWTVSFMTGDRYGRFFPEQRMMVRLVRDKPLRSEP